MENKVLITGLNIISSMGLNINDCWEKIKQGTNGVNNITLFDAKDNQTRFAAEVPKEFEEYYKTHIKKRLADHMTRVTKMCYVCAKDAIEMSGLNFDEIDKTKCGVIIGVVKTGNSSVEKATSTKNFIVKDMNNAMSAWISIENKLEGPNYTVSCACSSSAYAIGLGYDLIKLGRADIVIVGGADSIINPEEIEGFNQLYALSTMNDSPTKACCPFTLDRDGFVIGEGAGILLLESEKSAKKRNAKIYCELAGYAVTSEAYNIMAPMQDGIGMAKTMDLALEYTGVKKDDIDYINAHGTSTTLNDKYETMAIKKVFGDRAYKIPISSSKSMIGHTIGAAGAIEAVITALSVYEDIVTPTINYDKPDPELDLDYTPNKSRKHTVNAAISNSFAFGGHNASLVFRKYK